MKSRFLGMLWACVLGLVLINLSTAQAASFQGIGFLTPGLGDPWSQATGVSADGSVVVGTGNVVFDFTGYRWTDGTGPVDLGCQAGNRASADGSVSVGQTEGPVSGQAAMWTKTKGCVGLGFLPGGNQSFANDTSADGSVIVGMSDTDAGLGILKAFRWTEARGMVGLGVLPGDTESIARGVSWDGRVVVGSSSTPFISSEAFRFMKATGMVGLGFLTGDNRSEASDVSADGAVVVGGSWLQLPTGSTSQAFRWTKTAGMVGLGFLPGGNNSLASAVSADGSVVVGTGNSTSGEREAFIWDAKNGMRSIQKLLTDAGIDLTGWTLTHATDVSADGLTVVGDAISESDDSDNAGWIARLDPPSEAVGGSVRGMTLRTIRCDNRTTGQRIRVPTPDDSAWDCEAAGLKVEPGDKIRQIVTGTADGTEHVGGAVTGVDANKVNCYNLSTDRRVSIRLTRGDTTWDCEAAGLRVRTGDNIRQAVQGRAE
jgi:probable HAF family extracellular repeat protein